MSPRTVATVFLAVANAFFVSLSSARPETVAPMSITSAQSMTKPVSVFTRAFRSGHCRAHAAARRSKNTVVAVSARRAFAASPSEINAGRSCASNASALPDQSAAAG